MNDAPALKKANIPTTIYVSKTDRALQTSSSLHGYPRLGDFSKQQATIDGLDYIDVTEAIAGTTTIHAYHLKAPVLKDMTEVIIDGKRAEQRDHLISVQSGGSRYWILQ